MHYQLEIVVSHRVHKRASNETRMRPSQWCPLSGLIWKVICRLVKWRKKQELPGWPVSRCQLFWRAFKIIHFTKREIIRLILHTAGRFSVASVNRHFHFNHLLCFTTLLGELLIFGMSWHICYLLQAAGLAICLICSLTSSSVLNGGTIILHRFPQ